MQRILMVLSLLIVAVSGLVIIPVVARTVDVELFSSLTIVFMLTAFFGIFDVLKPAFIKHFSGVGFKQSGRYYIAESFRLSALWGMLACSVIGALLIFFFSSKVGVSNAMILATSAVAVALMSCFCAVLEVEGKVGLVQILRSTNTAFSYLTLMVLAILGFTEFRFYAIAFLGHQVLLTLVMFLCSKTRIEFRRAATKHDLADIRHTLIFNAYRGVVDFADRLIISKLVGSSLYAVFNSLSEVVSRGNLPVQYYNAYMYPELCRCGPLTVESRREYRLFLRNILSYFAVIIVVAGATIPYSDAMVGLYLGSAYSDYGYVLSLLVLATSMQVFNLSCVTILRADNQFDLLQVVYRYHIILFFPCAIILLGILGDKGLLVSVVLLKSASVGVVALYAEKVMSVDYRLVLISISAVISVMLGFIFDDFLVGFFGAVFFMLITMVNASIVRKKRFLIMKYNTKTV